MCAAAPALAEDTAGASVGPQETPHLHVPLGQTNFRSNGLSSAASIFRLQKAWLADPAKAPQLLEFENFVSITFDTDANGRIQTAYFRRESGNHQVDTAAMRILKKSLVRREEDQSLTNVSHNFRYQADFYRDKVSIRLVGRYPTEVPDAVF